MRVTALSLLLGTAAATELTPANWDELTAGKSVFIKFQAPWCGHCKKMKPDWDKLMKEYEGDATRLVADVDCTAAGKPLCDTKGVQGFPTIKYGSPDDLQDYEGGRTYKALKDHAEKKVVPTCSPKNIDLCDDEKKAKIEELSALEPDVLDAQIKEKSAELENVEKDFKAAVEKLQKEYEGLQKKKEDDLEAVKNSGLGLMKAVKAFKAGAQKEKKDEL